VLDNSAFSRVQDYLTQLVPPRPVEMQKMEVYAEKTGFPIIGPTAGNFCYQIARMIGARQIFELGSGYGYSTGWFAKAVLENGGGKVHHVVWDEELSKSAQKHLKKLGYDGVVEYHVGEAVQTLKRIPGPFDLVFNDIDKEAYATSLPTITGKLRKGGVLIVDNILWDGRVFDGTDQSGSTKAIRELTRLLVDNPDWITSIIPVRDGMILAYKV